MRLLIVYTLLSATSAYADMGSFTSGPVFKDFGLVADVAATMTVPPETTFRHSFDVAKPANTAERNKGLESAARFINMHVRAGVPIEHIELAVVVHGQAVRDVSDVDSASAGLVGALISRGTRIIVCGQSAAYYDVALSDLLPGVEMALSAMTAHTLLQKDGYTLNPF